MNFSAQIIRACVRAKVPCFLENPRSSKLFLAPPLARLLKLHSCQEFVSDYCQYGAPWRKITKVCAWFGTSETPCARCSGADKLCSRTGKPHIHLAGKSPQGVNWTKVAEAYPPAWAKQWAQVLIDSALKNIQRRIATLCHLV